MNNVKVEFNYRRYKILDRYSVKKGSTVSLTSGGGSGCSQTVQEWSWSTGMYETGASGMAGRGNTTVKLSLTSTKEVARAKTKI